jgi:hypothetical protein
MPRPIIDVTRRRFLLGAGGAALALPVLPSLLTSTAYGADPTFTRRPRLFVLASDHGGAFEASMFPSTSLLTSQGSIFSDHPYRYGTLTGSVSGSKRQLSPVLSADSTRFSPALLGKMNVLYGIDVPFYIAHSTGIHLGNYARNDGNGQDGKDVQDDPRPTIDQILAWSPTFYPDIDSIRERAMVVSRRPISFNYSSPASQSGSIASVRGYDSSRDLFDRIFVPPDDSMPRRAPVVDRVLESYRSLRNGNRRLSAADRQRLDDHMDRIAELQRKIGAGSGASCAGVTRPTEEADDFGGNNPEAAARWGQLYNDVVAAAFACGTSRVAVLDYGSTESFVSYGGDWHQEVAHKWQETAAQTKLVDSYQRLFETVFLDLAAKLDVEEAPGMTYLDNSLLVWTQESGMETHGSVSIPIVMFGSAAGFLKTGLFVDYRRTGNRASSFDPGAGGTQSLGLLHSQFLATVLRSMGLPPSEFERWGHKGYGVPSLTGEDWTPPYRQHYESTSSRYFQMASDVLPALQA